jgi:hypothetical protein
LKEFEGVWNGPLGGSLEARLIADSKDEFSQGSYIRNNLGVTLRKCILLATKEEVANGAFEVLCFQLGDIPASAPGSRLEGEDVHQRLYFERGSGRGAPTPLKRLPRLIDSLQQWQDKLRTLPSAYQRGAANVPRRTLDLETEHLAALFLSVFELAENPGDKGLQFCATHGRALDCTRQLTRNTAILIAWSDEPPPAVLQVDGDDLSPDRSRTLYRFLIPVEW